MATAIYEGIYPRQNGSILRHVKRTGGERRQAVRRDHFSEEFCSRPDPRLQAIDAAPRTRSRPPHRRGRPRRSGARAFLLELLSDFQVTVPKIGIIRAEHVPVVILTSNRTREIHDALKRRCLYHWIDFPDYDKEFRISQAACPGSTEEPGAADRGLHPGATRHRSLQAAGMAETLHGRGHCGPRHGRSQRAGR